MYGDSNVSLVNEDNGNSDVTQNENANQEVVEGFANMGGLNLQEMIRRMVKYLVEGLAVGVVGMALVLRKKRGNVNWNLQARDVTVMAVTAAAVFAVLDMWAPAISGSARQGAGFGLGANLVGFPVMR